MNIKHALKPQSSSAFTLIELSVVLIIIGLIVGGILVGRDLIGAAAVSSQIAQINKYSSAVNAFQDKYNGLPGDLLATQVSAFGFQVTPTRAGTQAQGNGNGLIEGWTWGSGTINTGCLGGETGWFWEDLSSNSGFIEGGFNTAGTAAYSSSTTISQLVPAARLGKSNYVVAYSVNGLNYFMVASVIISSDGNATLGATSSASPTSGISGITPQQAYNIDKKIDDGYPQTGSVLAMYDVSGVPGSWAGVSSGNAASPSPTTCYDNAGNASNTTQYTLSISSGRASNCALSFQFPN